MSAARKHPKTKFTPEEDFLLNRFVAQFGTMNWSVASSFLPLRSPRQCRERWMKYLCPTNSFEPFTQEEDNLLRQLFEQFGPKWMKISRAFRNRTDISLKNRWLVMMRHERRALEFATLDPRTPMVLDPIELSPVTNWKFSLHEEEGSLGLSCRELEK
jgi:hypothetical protein